MPGSQKKMEDIKQIVNKSRALIEQGQLDQARSMLAPAFEETPQATIACQLARIALKERTPKVAIRYLEAISNTQPPPFQPMLLLGRSYEQLGDIERAQRFFEQALAIRPGAPGARRGLDRTNAAFEGRKIRKVFEDTLARIDQNIETGQNDLAMEEAKTFSAHAALLRKLPWYDDACYAKVAHFAFSKNIDAALKNYHPALIAMSVEYGYLTWPRRIHDIIINKSVLDVGCGFGGYGTGFLAAGARTYTGLDPAMDLDSTSAKNKRLRERNTMPMTPREIMAITPDITLFQGKSEDISHDRHFEVISLHNVTEHLMDIETVFQGFLPLMTPETRIVFLHHHFFGWNGHHQAPVHPKDFNIENKKHGKYADWAHVINGAGYPEDDYIKVGLNQITLASIRELTYQYFDVLQWDEKSAKQDVLNRLTPDIIDAALQARPGITVDDLKLHTVFCVARAKKHARQ